MFPEPVFITFFSILSKLCHYFLFSNFQLNWSVTKGCWLVLESKSDLKNFKVFEIRIELSNLNPMLCFVELLMKRTTCIHIIIHSNKYIFYFLFCEKKGLRQGSCQILKLFKDYNIINGLFLFSLGFKTLKLVPK